MSITISAQGQNFRKFQKILVVFFKRMQVHINLSKRNGYDNDMYAYRVYVGCTGCQSMVVQYCSEWRVGKTDTRNQTSPTPITHTSTLDHQGQCRSSRSTRTSRSRIVALAAVLVVSSSSASTGSMMASPAVLHCGRLFLLDLHCSFSAVTSLHSQVEQTTDYKL